MATPEAGASSLLVCGGVPHRSLPMFLVCCRAATKTATRRGAETARMMYSTQGTSKWHAHLTRGHDGAAALSRFSHHPAVGSPGGAETTKNIECWDAFHKQTLPNAGDSASSSAGK